MTMMRIRQHSAPLLLILVPSSVALAALVVPLIVSDYWLFVLGQVLFYVLATQGLYLLFGLCGQLSIAHAASMGVAAYVGVVGIEKGLDPHLVMAMSVLAATVFGGVQAIPALRLTGLRLAVVTLAFGFLFGWTIENTQSLTGGTQGKVTDSLRLFGLSFLDPRDAFWIGLAFSVVATVLTVRIARSRLGLQMTAVRDSELAARSVGVHIARTKILAFLIGSAYAGMAGFLIAFSTGFVSMTNFDLFASSYLLVAVILGGATSVTGAWLGAAYVVIVPRLFSSVGLSSSFPLLGGVLLIVVALLAPGGIVGLIKSAWIRVAGLRRRQPSALEAAA